LICGQPAVGLADDELVEWQPVIPASASTAADTAY